LVGKHVLSHGVALEEVRSTALEMALEHRGIDGQSGRAEGTGQTHVLVSQLLSLAASTEVHLEQQSALFSEPLLGALQDLTLGQLLRHHATTSPVTGPLPDDGSAGFPRLSKLLDVFDPKTEFIFSLGIQRASASFKS
jgi:hypothetical protein